jgi:hypothetical protein
MHPSCLSLSPGSFYVPCNYFLPLQVVKGGGGMDLFFCFKIAKIVVSIKTVNLVSPLTKADVFSSPSFQLVSKLPINKEGGAVIKGLSQNGRRAKFTENLYASPFP